MRVLVTSASKNGSTEEIADAIADELMAYGLDVVCRSTHDTDAADVDAVILGSAVYAGRWLRPARHFLKDQSDRHRKLPFWIFSSGPFGERATMRGTGRRSARGRPRSRTSSARTNASDARSVST